MKAVTSSLAILVVAVCSNVAVAEDSTKRSAELQALGRFVGTWDTAATIKAKDGTSVSEKSSEIRRWSLGGKFVHFENARTENAALPEFHMLVTYDPAAKTYPGIMMVGPNRTMIVGKWDKETKTMTFSGTFADGNRLVFKNRFVDEDHIETSGVITKPSGDVIVEVLNKQTRRKK